MEEGLSKNDVHEHCLAFIQTLQSDTLWISRGEEAFEEYMGGGKCRNQKRLQSILDIKEDTWPPKDVAMFPLLKHGYWSLLVIYRSRGVNKIFHYDPSPRVHVDHATAFVRMLCSAGLMEGQKKVRIKRMRMEESAATLSVWRVLFVTQQILRAGTGGGLTPLVEF